ncbi:MAG: hypothetical protein AAFQ51_15515 [Pseudomonadota bacterium]
MPSLLRPARRLSLSLALVFTASGAQAALTVDGAEPRAGMFGTEVAQAVIVPVPRPGAPVSDATPEPAAVPVEVADPAPAAEAATAGTPAPDAVRPRPRPAAAVATAPDPVPTVDTTPEGEVVTVSLPKPRPGNLATRAAAIQEASARAREARANAASIANRQINSASTQSGILDVTQISLIGVFGTPQSRRALLRLSTGDFVRVSQGGSVNGWQVIAISPSSIRLSREGEVQVLDLPS